MRRTIVVVVSPLLGIALAAPAVLARRDAPYTGDNCGNGCGLDQNIYGSSLLLP